MIRRKAAPAGTVLVVDDDEEVRRLLAEVLESEGYEVAAAGDGEEALEYLRTHHPPALILLDLRMPRMDGWEFRAQQDRDPALSVIPVVVVTGVHDAELLEGAGDAIVPKPFDLRALMNAVRRYAGKGS
jgi:CheY-like chemotaxis protein